MNRTFSDGARRLWSGYQPLTNTLIAATVLFFLCDFVFAPVSNALLPFSNWLGFNAPEHWIQPWRLLTYPLVTWGSIIAVIFNGLLLWMVGGSLERSWGTKTLAIFYLALSLVTALAFTIASVVTGRPDGFQVQGGLVLAALLVGWCCLNPDESINLYGIIPIRLRYLAAGVCVIIFFSMGFGNPFIGLMAVAGCGFAVLWAKQDWAYTVGSGAPSFPRTPQVRAPKLRLIENKPPRPRDDRFTLRDLNPFEWIARRKRRKQFEKLINDD